MTHVALNLISDRFSFCLICDELIVEPVTLPCGHELCLDCFKDCIESANFSCCVCRKRVSTWARRHSTNPVNTVRKKTLNEFYASLGSINDIKLAVQLQKEEDSKVCPVRKCDEVPGEVKKEYLQELTQYQQERQNEEELSVKEVERCQIECQMEAIEFHSKRQAQIDQDERFAQALKVEPIETVIPQTMSDQKKLTIKSKVRPKRQKTTGKHRNLSKCSSEKKFAAHKLTKWFSPSPSTQAHD